jgi:hypothetical protein
MMGKFPANKTKVKGVVWFVKRGNRRKTMNFKVHETLTLSFFASLHE